MKVKSFLTGLVMAAVLCCIACSSNANSEQPSQQETQPQQQTEVVEIRDDDLFTIHDMYSYSDDRTIINHKGNLSKDVDFGTTRVSHYACLFPVEGGGFVKGFVNISTRGIALKVGKSFFFYNKLCLKKDPVDLYLPAAIVLKDGTILPAMVEVNGKDQPYYISIERKDNDVLSYKPLRGDIETMSFTVKQMKDYCLKEKITGDNVPFLKFNEVNKVTINKR